MDSRYHTNIYQIVHKYHQFFSQTYKFTIFSIARSVHDELHATCPGSDLLRARAQLAGMAAAAPLLPPTTRARMMDAYT